MPDDVIAIATLLTELGFTAAPSQRAARVHLHAAGLTNPTKVNIRRNKRDAAEEIVRTRIARSCGAASCNRVLAASGREVIEVEPSFCEVCRGSEGERALMQMADAMVAARRPRLLVLGGSPASRTQIRETLRGRPIEVEFIEGDRPTGERRARELSASADIIVIWGGTILDHKVSQPFADLGEFSAKRITVAQRGAASLARSVLEHLRRTA
ncbi:MAG: hypothetical protein EPO16_12315 [Dehalococcoidia bacterium]|nr:MAG: hypothetical protein EPO16_12315 [Dehalococcoidia bacterium]